MNEGKIKFPAPAGVVPEGVSDGEHFDVVCTLEVEGKDLCLVQVGDKKMPGYGEGGMDHKPDYSEAAKSMGNPGTEMKGYE